MASREFDTESLTNQVIRRKNDSPRHVVFFIPSIAPGNTMVLMREEEINPLARLNRLGQIIEAQTKRARSSSDGET